MRTVSVWSAVAAALAFVVLSVPPARAEELTGTWQGTLTGDGQAIEFTVAFSEDGYARSANLREMSHLSPRTCQAGRCWDANRYREPLTDRPRRARRTGSRADICCSAATLWWQSRAAGGTAPSPPELAICGSPKTLPSAIHLAPLRRGFSFWNQSTRPELLCYGGTSRRH